MPRIDDPKGQLAPGSTADAMASPSPWLVLGLVAFVLVFGAAGYGWLGHREGLQVAPGTIAAADAASASAAVGPAEVEALVQRLTGRLKSQPDDAEAWSMLGRSYAVLSRFPEALQALRHVIDLRPDDAQAHADYAGALGMANGRKLAGEPEKLIAKALQLDPDNAKALALAGALAFDRGDAALAARHWERALRNVEPGTETARQLQGALATARQRADSPAGAPGVAPRGLAASSVQVRVTLAPALQMRAAPDDTVFVFARAAQGPKAPLAIQRRQVKDLPLEFSLDDTMAMSPRLRLSSVTQVVVGARVSKSGSAMPQPGDLQGLSGLVAVGARGVEVKISDVVP